MDDKDTARHTPLLGGQIPAQRRQHIRTISPPNEVQVVVGAASIGAASSSKHQKSIIQRGRKRRRQPDLGDDGSILGSITHNIERESRYQHRPMNVIMNAKEAAKHVRLLRKHIITRRRNRAVGILPRVLSVPSSNCAIN